VDSVGVEYCDEAEETDEAEPEVLRRAVPLVAVGAAGVLEGLRRL
jgi:hypothetical protein